jgi:4-carboxymuconolactone decarboxylase
MKDPKSGAPSSAVHLTETAVRNHEELFPGHVSTLLQTDPEFIELFDNFAFDEVLQYGTLDTKTRLLAILGSTIACQALQEYGVMVGAALNVGVTPIEIKEVLYQAVPYVGIARAFDFLHTTNDILREHGIALPLDGQSTTDSKTRFDNGLALQKQIFGGMIERMYLEAPEDQKHIQRHLSANCFGDYYTRTGLDVKTRELLTFSMLISMGGTEPQIKGHVLGNVNVGNGKGTLITVITHLLPFIGYPRALNALRCINEVLCEPSPKPNA